MVFNALYYDGNSSFPNPVVVQLQENSIRFFSETLTLTWQISKLNLHESFFNKDKTVLKYGYDFPYSALEINGSDFQVFFERTYASVKIKQTNLKILQNSGNKAIALIILAVVGFFMLAYFILIPAAAEFVAQKLPQRYEVEIGDKLFGQIQSSFEIDSDKTALANSFFRQLKTGAQGQVNITVVHSSVSNAFALPGNHIVVYDNMFRVMKSKEEFAALLSHEYAHVANRHVSRSLFRSLGTYLVISLILTDVNGIMAVVLQNADNLKSMSYSRKLEKEADEKGMVYLLQSGISPNGMIDLFKHLKEADTEAQQIPEFLSSHPMLEDRMDYIRQLSKQNPAKPEDNKTMEDIWKKLKSN